MDKSCQALFTRAFLSRGESYEIDFSQLPETLPESLLKTMREVGQSVATINVLEAITPINQAEERQKWLAAAETEFTNPHFEYDEDLLSKIAELEPIVQRSMAQCEHLMRTTARNAVANTVAWITKKRVSEALNAISIAQGILERDDRMASKAMELIYGLPDTSAVDSAYQYAMELVTDNGMLSQRPVVSEKDMQRLSEVKYNAEQAKQAFVWVAQQCGFAETRPVEVHSNVSVINVRDRSSQGAMVMIPKGATYSGTRLLALTAHEILCHWRNSENIHIFSKNLQSSDELFYEGCAMYAQSKVELMFQGKTKRMTLPWRIIAIDLAKNGADFSKVAQGLYPMILDIEKNKQAALMETWKSAYRIFRGSTNTENNRLGYAFPKDRAYFEGKALVTAMHQSGLGAWTEFGAMTTDDLFALSQVVSLNPAKLKYQYPENLIMNMYEKIVGGDFAS